VTGQAPVLRIGGDSTDTTWWPTPGLRPPPGVTYSLSPRWLAVVGLAPVPGPFDEAALLLAALILLVFYRDRLRRAWREAISQP